MKYFETIHERNSAKITTLIGVILVLLLFIVGPPYFEPPLEYGVAVNFGTSELGSGDVQPTQPIKSEPQKVIEEPKVEASKIETSSPSNTKAENVLTEESAEAIAIKKQKQAEANAKAIADAKAKAEADRIAKEKQEQEDKKRKLDALIGGVSKSEGTATRGEGNDNKTGDKGQLDGNPYDPSYFGGSGPGKGGVGYGLGGRNKISNDIFKQECNEEGLVVVEIRVDRSGKVIKATPGIKGTTGTSCLFEAARKTALSFRFTPNENAPNPQVGFVSINFDISQ